MKKLMRNDSLEDVGWVKILGLCLGLLTPASNALHAEVIPTSIPASATFIMQGSYLRVGLSKNGTLGVGESTKPGLQYDKDGGGNFGNGSYADNGDYLTPGTPHEIFAVKIDGTNYVNNNTAPSSGQIPYNLPGHGTVQVTGRSFDNYVRWTGGLSGEFDIQQDMYFNNGDRRINFEVTLTARKYISSAKYLRSIDPDPMAGSGYSSSTNNGRGGSGIPAENWVHATQAGGIFPLGLFSASHISHNTGISSGWSVDPDYYLGGAGSSSNEDATIGIAFSLGAMNNGESRTFKFAYIVSGDLADAIVNATSVSIGSSQMSLLVGETVQATTTVLPTDADQSVSWSSSNPALASVNSAGVVTAIRPGIVTITATSLVTSSVSGTSVITVRSRDNVIFFGSDL